MSDCKSCLKSLRSAKVKVSCVDCKAEFHGKCVNITAEEVNFLAERNELWRCDPCSKARRKSMVLESKSSITCDDIFNLIGELREDFRRVEVSLGASLNSCHEELAETKEMVVKQREEIAAWMKAVEELKIENSTLKKQVANMESRLEDAEQYSRRNTLEIHGIPVQQGENVVTLVKAVGRALDYPVDDSMIDACHRLRSREASGKPPGIVVKMVRRVDAESLTQKRRVKRNLNTHDIGLTSASAQAVYVNESLSPARRRLLFAARQVKKEKGYTYLWIRGGKILFRKDQGASVKVVVGMEDLKNL